MPRTKAQDRVYQLARYHRRQAEAVRLLGGKCVKCGTIYELQFDHIDPATKLFTISKLQGSYASFLEELKKCQLLCVEHHREKHRSTAPCGTTARYACGCRCDACRAAHNKVFNEWRYRVGLRNRRTVDV